ncbi:MAG TPA: NAD(P)-dependent oxidoreductase [Acidimicrobiales bacterium]|nr:NAD(P)-dependent oxidoreductase [Acidimicrobiales bacterium]
MAPLVRSPIGAATGFIGLGRMGFAMASRLVAAGERVVVYNRTRAVAERFVAQHGGEIGESPAVTAAGCDVLIAMVEGDLASSSVLLGDEGVIRSASPGQVVIEMATISPQHARECSMRFAEVGVAYLDAPVSGSVDAALSGQLSVMVGGSPSVLERVEPMLEHMAARISLLGGTGAGALGKLGVNLVLYALAEGVAEALALVSAAGLDSETFYTVLQHSAAGAPLLDYRRAVFLDPDSEPPRFTMSLVARDLELAVGSSEEVGVGVPQARLDLAIAQAAVASGYADDDLSALARPEVRRMVAAGLGARASTGTGLSGAQDEGVAEDGA